MAQAGETLYNPSLGARSAERIAAFANVLRANGFALGLAESRDALAVLASPAGRRPALLKPALRALFSATLEDWRRFDELFDAFWRGKGMRRIQPLRGAANAAPGRRRPLPSAFTPDAPQGAKESGARDDESGGASMSGDRRDAASSAEALASRDIRLIADPEEIAKVHALAERFARRMRARLVRRWRARRRGPRLDLRRTIHHSVAHGGTPIDLVWRRRKLRPLRLVLLLDASGSMELYTAFFARFLHAAVDAFREAEAFVFHTRTRRAWSIRAPPSSSCPTATTRASLSGDRPVFSAGHGDAPWTPGSLFRSEAPRPPGRGQRRPREGDRNGASPSPQDWRKSKRRQKERESDANARAPPRPCAFKAGRRAKRRGVVGS
jgi:uncharacterized protein with von Willebrand factor type A (vWA) domain